MFMFREHKLKMNKMKDKEYYFREELADLLRKYEAELFIEEDRIAIYIEDATPVGHFEYLSDKKVTKNFESIWFKDIIQTIENEENYEFRSIKISK